ncbi:hypothetical protein [Clostridium beijerinckii]|nr:hypothetical protein [Clostridium beijerinckii]
MYTCPVCNYNELDEAPYNARGYGSDEICPCCGFQFGCDDYPNKEEGQKKWREKWIKNGYKWYSKSILPSKGWDPRKQIEKIISD